MTTDTKAVARYRTTLSHGLIEMQEHPVGPLIFFADHERVVGELGKDVKDALYAADVQRIAAETLRAALAASRAEVEGLKKDAERYRWLRDHAPEEWDISIGRGYGPQNDQVTEVHVQDYLDEAIDAAMEKGNV